MFGIAKDRLIKGLARLVAKSCSYTKQPCDCKYMQDDDNHINPGSERGSGCPEMTMAAMLIAHMTNQEFSTITRRAGIQITEEADLKAPDVLGMIAKFQEARFTPMIVAPKTSKKKAK